jgi:hypothetical protein
MIQYGPWEPDSAAVNAAVMAAAKNVYPTKTGYGPIPSLSEEGSGALAAKCFGKFSARTSAGGYISFAGTQTKLYRKVSGVWTDYTRTSGGDYNVPTDDYWSFVQFGSLVIACNINDDPQVIDIDTGATAFAALSGSPPRARYAAVVGDFVILACVSTNNRKARNSAINDATGWTVGTNLCDEQEFADGGRVTGIAGGEFGYVLQERSIRRMIFQPGSDTAFRFERVEKERGAAAGYSLAATINAVFFLSDDGFYSFGSQGLTPIGSQRVNKWFRENSDTERYFSVLAFTDPYSPRICWAFYNATGSANFDRLLVYDWSLDRWSYAEIEAQYWCASVTAGLTLEDLDVYGSIDTGVPFSLDSRVWEGGQPVISAINTSYKEAYLEGSTPLTATLLTAPLQLNPTGRSLVQATEPIGVFNDATLAVRVGKREHTKNAVVYTTSATPSTRTNIARTRASGRLHEVELTITQSTGTAWKHAQGVDLQFRPDGVT